MPGLGPGPREPQDCKPRPDPVRTGELLCRAKEHFSPVAGGSRFLQTSIPAPLAEPLGSQLGGTWAGERGSPGEDEGSVQEGGAMTLPASHAVLPLHLLLLCKALCPQDLSQLRN